MPGLVSQFGVASVPGVDGVFIVIFLVLALGALGFALYSVARRSEAAQTVASSLGLQYSSGDPRKVVRLPHDLFERGDSRRIETTVFGSLEGREVVLCDYVYTDITRDAKGNTHHTDHRMSVVVLGLREPLPSIEISPEGLGRRFLNAVGVGNDVQFESDEFNRAFKVISNDRDFAFTLIDAGMIDWLLGNSRSNIIEIEGEHAVMATRSIRWEQMPEFINTLMAFEDRFPRLVWEKYRADR